MRYLALFLELLKSPSRGRSGGDSVQ